MTESQSEFVELFSRLKPDQQSDIIALLKTWVKQQQTHTDTIQTSGDVPISPISQNPSYSKEWHCLAALKEVVEKHFQPKVELAYIAFHPDLDSVSSAKSRAAVKQMYLLEAAYELKRILEADPDSEILDPEAAKTLHGLLSRE